MLTVLGFGLFACGGDGGQVVLRIAWMGAELETFRTWKTAFEAEHPGVTVEMQFIPYDHGPTVYNTMIQGDNLPDLGYVFMGMISEFAERGILEPLDSYMTPEVRNSWL
ncbi:MAG: extracellular solute-binding protein, partial [bacterium]|nr:extracellular solute-binding protein [bacterium]